MGSFNVNPTTILSKIHVRTPTQAESLSSRYSFLNLNNAEPNLGKPPGIFGGTYYSTLTSDEYLGIRYALLSNNHSGSAWRVWAYDNPRIAAYSKEGSLGIGDNAYPLNIKSFVYSNYAFDNQNNRYNSQSFSNKTFNVFALSGIYLFDSTTIGDPASAIAFIVTDQGNVGVGTENPPATLSIIGTISGSNITTSFNSGSATGERSFAVNTGRAFGTLSHAEGSGTTALGNSSHAEGLNTTASGIASHAEGSGTTASGSQSHAEGLDTTASGNYSHAAGAKATAVQDFTYAWSDANLNTTTANIATTRTGQYMVSASGGIFFPGNVGIGTDQNTEKLTVVGNISATGSVITSSLTSRFINLTHTPANDGSNPFIRIGETDTAGFSGFNLLYNENQNKLQLVTDFGGVSLTAASIDRNANASGPLFPYMVTMMPTITSNLVSNVNTIHYPPSLSGVIDASEITNRFTPGKGYMVARVHAEAPVNTANSKRIRLEFANNSSFTSNTIIINTSDINLVSLCTQRDGIFGNDSIITFQSSNQSTQEGNKTSALSKYSYVTGDPIYWRWGFGLATGTEVFAICAAYIRISPY
jgi:hypothetical protein